MLTLATNNHSGLVLIGFLTVASATLNTQNEPQPATMKLELNLDFFDVVDQQYAALRSDPAAWKQEMAERESWDETLSDGLPPK